MILILSPSSFLKTNKKKLFYFSSVDKNGSVYFLFIKSSLKWIFIKNTIILQALY